MSECFGNFFILNGELQSVESFDNSVVYEGDSIYEVIRMVKECPVFFHDHMDRLYLSLRLQGKNVLADRSVLKDAMIRLIRSDRSKETNIKIVFNYKNGSENWLIYLIESLYPTAEQYEKGVKGILYFAERKDPESKVIDHKLRSSIYHQLVKEGSYEAILVNEKNLITEGSRTNIFFLKNKMLVTAPDNCILKGITRKYILEICSEKGIKVKLDCVCADDIAEYDTVFMTGTSPMVLPFYKVGDIHFNVNLPLLDRLRKLYMIKVSESIRLFRPE